jgi:predicted transcriptional regulator
MKNPFLAGFKLNLVKVSESRTVTDVSELHKNEGVILKYETINKTYHVEQQEKLTTLYKISYKNNVIFGELSSTSHSVLLYIMYNLKKDTDFINLKIDILENLLKLTKPTIIKAFKELIDAAIITKRSQSEYWINPHFIFNGNRIDYYNRECPECIETSAILNK